MTEPCIIAKLSVKAWGATRTDKEVSEEVARSKGASSDAGKYVKNLIERSALKEIRSSIQTLRDLHKEYTRPWDDDGRRLLPLAVRSVYEGKLEEAMAAYKQAVADFVREYPGMRDYAEMNLGELFNADDYPSEAEIESRFSVDIDYEPVPEGRHAPEGYGEQVEASVRRKMAESHTQLYNRIVNALSDMNRKLRAHDERLEAGDKRGRFRLTVLEELETLADILPGLNIENDPFLAGVGRRIKQEIQGVSGEDLRDDEERRKSMIADVDELISEIEGRP